MLHARQLSGLLIVAGLAGTLFVGSASALPAPVMAISSSTAGDPSPMVAAPTDNRLSSTTTLAQARPGVAGTYTLSEKRLATGRVDLISGPAGERTRSKARYLKTGLLLAAMTAPIALLGSRLGGASEGDLAAEARTPSDNGASTSLALSGSGDDDDDCEDEGQGGITPGDVEDHDDGGAPQGLPEPKTVLLIGTGLVTLLSFRNRGK
jgi:hypothetical protein